MVYNQDAYGTKSGNCLVLFHAPDPAAASRKQGHQTRGGGTFMHVTHGLTHSIAYQRWKGMRGRCLNPQDPSWHNYGGRGITIDPSWDSFEQFYRDMGNPEPGMTLDRIDNSGNYGPGNCRWTSVASQSRNRRGCINITHEGRTQTLEEWAREVGISRPSLAARYQNGDKPPWLFRPRGFHSCEVCHTGFISASSQRYCPNHADRRRARRGKTAD